MINTRPYDKPQKAWIVCFKIANGQKRFAYGYTKKQAIQDMEEQKERAKLKYEQKRLKLLKEAI